MSSASLVSMDGLTAEAYQDTVRTLKAIQEICQRLDKWAVKELADPSTSLPLHDLVQYCEVAHQQLNAYFASQQPLIRSEFVQEQVWRGLGAFGFESTANSNRHDMLMLDLLLAECKRRTLEILDLLEKKLEEKRKPIRKHKLAEGKAQQTYDCHRFFTAVKAVHHNNDMRGESQYMLEKSRHLQEEAATHLLPKIFAFGDDLSKVSERGLSIDHSKDSLYPGNAQVQEIMQKFLYLSTDWAEYLQTITDPLYVDFYQTSSDVPYKEAVGVATGSGSFGIVYKAESTNTRTVVAIKQLSGIYTMKSQDTVRKELSMLQICDHPNIVKLLDAYQINDHPGAFYLVMEPWAPYTLSRFLHQSDSQRHHDSPWFTRGNYKTERQVIQILRGLANGLSYLHDKSIKHKDLKPENILLYDAAPRGIRPVIADLGISKIFKDGNPTDYNKSTYAYLAPEQVSSVGSTLRSDVWQLGCCFALILAVFRQGSAGCRELWNSFENSNGGCSCNIALEAPAFMKTFETLCGHGSICQLSTHRLTTAMLEVDPELRFDIATVRTELADL